MNDQPSISTYINELIFSDRSLGLGARIFITILGIILLPGIFISFLIVQPIILFFALIHYLFTKSWTSDNRYLSWLVTPFWKLKKDDLDRF